MLEHDEAADFNIQDDTIPTNPTSFTINYLLENRFIFLSWPTHICIAAQSIC